MNKKILIVLVLILVGGVVFYYTQAKVSAPEVYVCTMDAKMCPDGSYVGRSGSNCEFTACPVVKESTEAKVGEKILSSGVYITPVEVLSDSRCPEDVVCVWAGELKLKTIVFVDSASFSEQEVVFTLGVPSDIEGRRVTLVDASPNPRTDRVISPSEYTFTFLVK